MSAKISALPAATKVANADEFVIVRGGVNNKATRDIILEAEVAQDIQLTGATGSTFFCPVAGGLECVLNPAEPFTVSQAAQSLINCDAAGDVTINPQVGGQLLLSATPCSITIDGATPAIQITCGLTGVIGIEFHAAVPGNWVVAPSDVWAAINRLAAVVAALNGGPIP